jgi:NAD-dependent SIR2 family protein deacetylase
MIWKNAFTTSVFYMFISSLRQRVLEVKDTTETHKFLRALRDGGRLVRNYTQNIDMLEQRVGLSGDLNQGPGTRSSKAKRLSGIGGDINQQRGCESVPLHGTLSKLRCNLCFQHSDWDCEERKLATLSGTAPDCPFCTEASAKRTGNGRRGLAVGRLRPDIVLYGEEHPHANLISPLVTNDLGLALDVMLIMGTSLRVHGLKVMVKEFAKAIHARGGKVVFVNRTRPSESTWGDVIDYWVEMDCDEWVLDLKDRRGDIWSPQGTIVERPARRKSAGTAVERPARRKSEGDAATMSKKRPQATRDDKINGVFITFKILDTLLKFPDSRGHQGTRHPYWQSTSRYSSASVIDVKPAKKALVKKQPSKPPIKMASKASISKAPVMKTIPPMAKLPTRHSMPLKLDTNRNNQAYIVSDVWQRLREKAPGLPAIPPELRQPFTELPGNLPSYLTPFEFGASNHFPNLGGRKEWPLEKMGMDLMHLPPKGLTIPMHTPTSMKPVVPKPINHSYGTRASARGSNTETIVVDSGFPSTPSNSSRHASTQIDTCHTPNTSAAHKSTLLETEDTIIVDDPLTPSSSRIKRLSSIGNLMSSPEDGTEIWHDAPELPEVTTETI